MNEVNNIPEGWVETTLGEIAKVQTGPFGSQLKNEQYITGGTPVVTVGHIVDFKIKNFNYPSVTEEDAKRLSKYLLKEGDIVFTRVGSVDLSAYVNRNQDGWMFSSRMLSVRPSKKINSKFLSYFFQQSTFRNYLLKIAVGATMPSINTSILKEIPVSYPSLSIQKSIASILTSFDDKIELLQAQNKTLEELAQTLFKEWFGKYKVGDELPDGWGLGVIGDIIGELESGVRPKGGVGNISEGIPSVGAESINGITNFDFSKTKFVPLNFFQKMNRGIVKDYDILIYKDGGTPGTFIPRFSIFGEGFPFRNMSINEHVFRVQPKMDYQRFYLYNWLNSHYCKKQLQNIGGKAAIPGINSTDLKGLEVLIPPDDYLKLYNDTVKCSYKKILTNMIQIQTLSKTRDALLPKLMSGQIRVKN